MADKTKRINAEDYQHYLKHGHFPNEPKPSKYFNKMVEWGGETFDSKWEWERWMVLMQMEAEGKITDLKRQVAFVLRPAFKMALGEHVRAIKYIADFTYSVPNGFTKPVRANDGFDTTLMVIEDAKGFETDVFRLKWKLLKDKYKAGAYEFVLSRKGKKTHG